jgi:hypothetical protein
MCIVQAMTTLCVAGNVELSDFFVYNFAGQAGTGRRRT